jgi:2'-5' RNA ligase superfamily
VRGGLRSIIVPVGEAEPLVDEFRRRGDWSRRLGVPAHVTLVGSLPPAAELPRDELTPLAAAAIGTGFVLERVGLLGGSVCLLAAADEPLAALGRRLAARLEPGSGRRPRRRHHLTVWRDAPAMLPEISAAIEPGLPIEAEVRSVCVATLSQSGSLTIESLAGPS